MKTLLTPFIGMLLLVSCKEIEGPPGPPGPATTGNISGWVSLMQDSLDLGPFPFHDSVLVSNLFAPSRLAFSDSTGAWTLTALPPGVYTLIFSKAGYFQLRLYGQQFVGAGTLRLPRVYLFELPHNSVSQLTVSRVDTSNTFHFQGRLAIPNDYRAVIVMLTTNPPTNPSRFDYFYYTTGLTWGDSLTFLSSVTLNGTFRSTYNIHPGMPIYIVAIPIPGYYNYQIQLRPNPETNLYEFENTGVSLSPVDTFVVP